MSRPNRYLEMFFNWQTDDGSYPKDSNTVSKNFENSCNRQALGIANVRWRRKRKLCRLEGEDLYFSIARQREHVTLTEVGKARFVSSGFKLSLVTRVGIG